jgi:hypothetical protein
MDFLLVVNCNEKYYFADCYLRVEIEWFETLKK